MVVLCQTCDKSFANKRSLATHKSRIHSKTMKEDAKQQSDSDATESENDSEATSNSSNDSDNSLSESKENDSGYSSASGSAGSDSDLNTTGTDNNDLEVENDTDPDYKPENRGNRKRKSGPLFGQKNKKVRANTAVKDEASKQMMKVLKSLDKRFKSSNCKDKKCPLDYLLSYELKNGVFNHIEELLRGHGKDLDVLLTMEEKSLLNAVLDTENLTVVHKLLNENGKMVARIVKLYTEHSKTQRAQL